jgi:DNA repair exonuclease SbcCD nuclease subunit
MFRFVFFADLHLHNFRDCSTVDDRGYNTRFLDGLHVLHEIFGFAVEQHIDYVFFGGDLFDNRSQIPTEFLSAVYDVVSEYTREFQLVAYPGNHDFCLRVPGMHTLLPLYAAGATVYSRPTIKNFAGVNVAIVPYVSDRGRLQHIMSRLKGDGNTPLILMHQGIKGVESRSGFVLPGEPLTLKQLRNDVTVISGHIHECQEIDERFYYVGSPMQLDWGDVGIDKYFFVVEVNNDFVSIEPIQLAASPRFIELTVESNYGEVSDNFVRFKCTNAEELAKVTSPSVRDAIQKLKPRFFASPVMVAEDAVFNGSSKKVDLNVESILEAYVDDKVDSPKQKEVYKRLGKKIVRSV